jgi:hypothetical protein
VRAVSSETITAAAFEMEEILYELGTLRPRTMPMLGYIFNLIKEPAVAV